MNNQKREHNFGFFREQYEYFQACGYSNRSYISFINQLIFLHFLETEKWNQLNECFKEFLAENSIEP